MSVPKDVYAIKVDESGTTYIMLWFRAEDVQGMEEGMKLFTDRTPPLIIDSIYPDSDTAIRIVTAHDHTQPPIWVEGRVEFPGRVVLPRL